MQNDEFSAAHGMLRVLAKDHEADYGPYITKYDAACWCWGDAKVKEEIILNGFSVQVPANAVHALQGLRNHINEGYVWINAICINQDDRQERPKQVFLMSDIHSGAARTLVWLGEEGGCTNAALRYLACFAELQTARCRPAGESSVKALHGIAAHINEITTAPDTKLTNHDILICASSDPASRSLKNLGSTGLRSSARTTEKGSKFSDGIMFISVLCRGLIT